jgi:MFS transporter, DHA1 family, multidrug resistance protein B
MESKWGTKNMGFKKLNLTLKARLISNFFQETITTAFLPFIALYLTDMVNAVFSGMFLSILVILNLPIALLGGYLIEILPKKKSVLAYQLVMSISLLVMAISLLNGSHNLILFCVSYSIFSITTGLQFSAMDTIIMDAITPDSENVVYKISYWLSNLAVALGALLGGILYSSNKFVLLLSSSVIFFLVFLSLWKWIKPDNLSLYKTKSIHSFKNIIKSYDSVLRDKRYLVLTLSFSFLLMAELSTSSYVSVRLKESFEAINFLSIEIDGVKMFSLLMIVNTLVVVAGTYIIIRIFSSLPTKWLLSLGLFLYVLGYSNIIHLNNFTLLIIFMVIATVGEIIYAPIFNEKKYIFTPEGKRGTYSGVTIIGFKFSELMARFSIVLGAILTPISMAAFVFAVLSVGAVLMYLSIFKDRDRSIKSNSSNKGRSFY